MKKLAIVTLYVFFIILTVLYKDILLNWVQDENQNNLLLMMLVATFLALFPIMPFGFVGGVMGIKYGVLTGGLINITASCVAALLMFTVVRYAFFDWGQHYIRKVTKLGHFTSMMEKHAFISLIIARVIPILPSPAINIYSAISKIPFHIFIVSTFIGKIPAMLVFAFIGEQFFTDPYKVIQVTIIYAVFLFIVFLCYRRWVGYKVVG